jgi:hypothetical protein
MTFKGADSDFAFDVQALVTWACSTPSPAFWKEEEKAR